MTTAVHHVGAAPINAAAAAAAAITAAAAPAAEHIHTL